MADATALRYRLAAPADASRIADLHTDSWRRSYRGILTDGYLDGRLASERSARWRAWSERSGRTPATLTVLAEAGPDELVGFVHVEADADEHLGALVDNLHVHHDWRRRGIARRLMAEAGRWAAERGQPGVYLYVLAENTRAQAFYDGIGGVQGGLGTWQPPEGPEVEDYEYRWPDVGALAALLPPGAPPLR